MNFIIYKNKKSSIYYKYQIIHIIKMVLSYVPCDLDAFSYLYKDYKKIKNLDKNEANELFWGLLDDRFCKCKITKGVYKGKLCMKEIKDDYVNNGFIYCRTHRYQEMECKVITCVNKRRKGYDICTKHLKLKTKIESVDESSNDNYIYYHSNEEKDEINLFNNLELFIDIEGYPYMDNFRCYYTHYNIFKIKFRNDFALPKNYFDHKSIYETYENKPIIKYNNFSLMKYLYNIYNRFKENINNFVKKYNTNICFLYYLILLIKKLNEKDEINDVILYENKQKYIFNNKIYEYIVETKYDNLYKYIYKLYNKNSINIFNTLLNTNKNNQVIVYDNVFKSRLKKYIENKKKRNRKKKSKHNKNKILDIKHKDMVNVNDLNNKIMSEHIDSGFICIKIWPMEYKYYNDFLEYEIIYFHCFITDDINDKFVLLFYKDKKDLFNCKEITYKHLYNLLIREYNKESVIKFIKYYYRNNNLI